MPCSLNWDVSTPPSHGWSTNPPVLSMPSMSRSSELSEPTPSSCICHHMPCVCCTKKTHKVECCDEYGTILHSDHHKCLECQHIKKPCELLPTKFTASALALSCHKDELGNNTPLDNDLIWDVCMWTCGYEHWVRGHHTSNTPRPAIPTPVYGPVAPPAVPTVVPAPVAVGSVPSSTPGRSAVPPRPRRSSFESDIREELAGIHEQLAYIMTTLEEINAIASTVART